MKLATLSQHTRKSLTTNRWHLIRTKYGERKKTTKNDYDVDIFQSTINCTLNFLFIFFIFFGFILVLFSLFLYAQTAEFIAMVSNASSIALKFSFLVLILLFGRCSTKCFPHSVPNAVAAKINEH